MAADDDGLRAFFAAYGRAFEAYDDAGIASCYVTPCLFVRDGETAAAASAEAVLASVRALLDLHRAWDVQKAKVSRVTVLEHEPGHALARVDWRLGRPKSRMSWRYATTYALVPDPEQGWRIASAITHDAPF